MAGIATPSQVVHLYDGGPCVVGPDRCTGPDRKRAAAYPYQRYINGVSVPRGAAPGIRLSIQGTLPMSWQATLLEQLWPQEVIERAPKGDGHERNRNLQ